MRTLLLLLLLAACEGDPHLDTSDTTDTFDPADPDHDGDGFPASVDCDDDDPLTYPGAPEQCDGKDNDCDDALADGEADTTGDGLPDCTRCDQAGYWQTTWALDAVAELRAAIHAAQPSFSCHYQDTTTYMFLDLDNQGGTVECIYTGRTTTVFNEKPDGENDMNTEHLWPQSQGADQPPARCDLHHLAPSDVTANNQRANYPFGFVVSSVTWQSGGSRLGRDASGATVFEPRTVRRGDVARAMLYFALRYGHTLPAAQVDLFQAWHVDDPVDAREWSRTQAIADRQGFANPFVACPDLVERAW